MEPEIWKRYRCRIDLFPVPNSNVVDLMWRTWRRQIRLATPRWGEAILPGKMHCRDCGVSWTVDDFSRSYSCSDCYSDKITLTEFTVLEKEGNR
jgi:hypothetical protein